LKGCFKGGDYLPLIITNQVPESLGPVSNLRLLDDDSNKIFIFPNRVNLLLNNKSDVVYRQ
jgi:hypothetical protein